MICTRAAVQVNNSFPLPKILIVTMNYYKYIY